MQHVIFYSWQADLPNSTNRGFIQAALEEAASSLAEEFEVQPVIERDTQNVPGSPDIAITIFKKITKSDVFVADVTLINPASSERRTPNPNVLLELGYAMHALGEHRIILTMNTRYGPIENLPFDLKMRRVIPYHMSTDGQKAPERKRFAAILKAAIKAAIDSIPPIPPTPDATNAAVAGIEAVAPNRSLLIRRAMQELIEQLQRLSPPLFRHGGTDEQLVNAINETIPTVRNFTTLASSIAAMNDTEAARTLLKTFSGLFERYRNPRGFTGTSDARDFDYWKFLGHEFMVTFIAKLLDEERYETIATLLDETITINNPSGAGIRAVNFEYASEHLQGLEKLRELNRRISYHADLLHARHANKGREQAEVGPLADVLPFDDFLAADYFLWLRGELSPDQAPQTFFAWRPWSSVYLQDVPAFIHKAQRAKTAEALAKALGVPDVPAVKTRLQERSGRLTALWRSGIVDQPLTKQDIERIGTR